MANRGMLPKFRPAVLGDQDTAARPSIRLARSTVPPPSPPPRRVSYAMRRSAPHGLAIESTDDETSTLPFEDPPTVSAVHPPLRERPLPSWSDDRPRSFDEEETQALQGDDDRVTTARALAHLDEPDPYDALPSLETACLVDDHEDASTELEAETQLRGGRYSDEFLRTSAFFRAEGHAAPGEDSGPRPRRDVTPASRYDQYDAPAYEELDSNSLREDDSGAVRHEFASQAPAVSREMQVPAGFVVGVQPIRTPSSVAHVRPPHADAPAPEAFPAPHPPTRAYTPTLGVSYESPVRQAQSSAQFDSVNASAQYMAAHAGASGPFAPPVDPSLQMTHMVGARRGSKIGRFAWFVFGAAFGLFFAFCATGFVQRLSKKEASASPASAQLPTQEHAAVTAMRPQAVAVTPPQAVPVQPVAVTALPAAPPPRSAVATAPRTQRSAANPRKNAPPPPPSSAPRALPNSGGSVDADDVPSTSRASASKNSKGGVDVGGLGDLLNAGLGP